jgi:hypothetical protein
VKLGGISAPSPTTSKERNGSAAKLAKRETLIEMVKMTSVRRWR